MSEKKNQIVWGVHAGKTGDANTLFLRHNVVALGWMKIGNLNNLPADREVFKTRIAEVYPSKKAGAIPIDAGQLFRFIHEMNKGDLIAYPSKHDKQIHIAKITGSYRYNTELEPAYPHHRPVQWLKALARTNFTQGALYEIGSAMSFFQIKNYADEFISALGTDRTQSPVEDETVALVAEDIEQTTRDFILKRLTQELKGHSLSYFVAHLLGTMGYQTRVSSEGPDGGVDIIAHKDQLGFEPPIVKVQIKSGEGTVGEPVVTALYGNVAEAEYGLLVTLGTFTNQAKNFARGKSNLRLIDGQELVDLILQHYERFDSRYKGLFPLKKVYVPEMLEEPEA